MRFYLEEMRINPFDTPESVGCAEKDIIAVDAELNSSEECDTDSNSESDYLQDDFEGYASG